MSIELTTEQAQSIASEDSILFDSSPWTPSETGSLAGETFGKLDNTDYSEYLREDS
jgi:hypothetical protein